MTPGIEQSFNIMIVDDTPANLKLLEGMLRDRGYQVRAFPRGRLALAAAAQTPPDLILLDINMPEMTGYQVCDRLKADPKLAEIPVLFISALSETIDKVKAFGAGGVDYVTKPFQFEEVEARVRTHLQLHRHKIQLQNSYDQLQKLESLRDNLTHMIVHDMRSPLSNILMMLEVLQDTLAPQNADATRLLRTAQVNASALVNMITQLLDIGRLEANQMPLEKANCDLVFTTKAILNAAVLQARDRRLLLFAPEPLTALCDPGVIGRVIQNLVDNALKFTPPNGQVQVRLSRQGPHARVTVLDDGPGIPPQSHQRIFEKFAQIEGDKSKYGTGLGLTFCKLAVEAHGGRIGVDSDLGKGSAFWFELPL